MAYIMGVTAFFSAFYSLFSFFCLRYEKNVIYLPHNRVRYAKTIHLIIKTIQIMNKTELIEKIAGVAGLTKTDAKKALEATVGAIKGALVEGEKVQLVGFGTFSVAERPAHVATNPATKAKVNVPAKKVAKFKAGSELVEALK